jgi:hypothetical protein
VKDGGVRVLGPSATLEVEEVLQEAVTVLTEDAFWVVLDGLDGVVTVAVGHDEA